MVYTTLSVALGLLFVFVGLKCLWRIKATTRCKGLLWGITYVIGGLWALILGTLRVAYALGHPLLDEDVEVIWFLIHSMIGLISGLISVLVDDYRKKHDRRNA
jgi:hypothetical protein